MTDIMNNETSFIEIKEVSSNEDDQILVSGKFNINYQADCLSVDSAEVLKHIVLVVTRSANYQALTPFQDVIVFDDDVTETEEGCSGSFNFNLFDKIGFDGSGDYYILCSLGTVTSNIIHARFDEQ